MAQATSIAVALHPQRREGLLARIELTPDQLTPPDLDKEESAIEDDSAHDEALRRLRDFLLMEFDEIAPWLYAAFARFLEGLKSLFYHPEPFRPLRRAFAVSIANPDKVSSNVPLKDDIARYLMRKKQAAVTVLAQDLRRKSIVGDGRGRYAAQTLELISGRRFHHDRKVDEAEHLLDLHGE